MRIAATILRGATGHAPRLWRGIVKLKTRVGYMKVIDRFCAWANVHEGSEVRALPAMEWDPIIARLLFALRRLWRRKRCSEQTLLCFRYLLKVLNLSSSRAVMKAAPSTPHQAMSRDANVLALEATLNRCWFSVAGWQHVSFICLLRVKKSAPLSWTDVFFAGDVRFSDTANQISLEIFYHNLARSPDALTVSLLVYLFNTEPCGD